MVFSRFNRVHLLSSVTTTTEQVYSFTNLCKVHTSPYVTILLERFTLSKLIFKGLDQCKNI